MSDRETIRNVALSNIAFAAQFAVPPFNFTWRWQAPPEQPVLVYLEPPTASGPDYASETHQAIDAINRKLKGRLVLQTTTGIPEVDNYIHVSYGTSYVEDGDYQNCLANVATAKHCKRQILPSAEHGIASRPVHMNLGNPYFGVSVDIVIHEFGHALGLARHFEGFGEPEDGPPFDEPFWAALATLYAHPHGTAMKKLKVQQAAP
jgi:hypothetical protein